MLKITAPNGALKLSPDIEIPLTIVNPMVNERGSYTLPFSLPVKPNFDILGNISNHANKSQSDSIIDVILEHTGINEKGRLQLGENDSKIQEVTLTTREGAFWDWAKSINMRNINTLADREIDFVNERENYFNNIWPAVEMAFFPIATNFIALDAFTNQTYWNGYCTNKLCRSEYVLTNNPGDLFRDDYGSYASGYISGFLYLNEVIQWIANTYGFKVSENFLASTNELKSAVVLNNAWFTSALLGGYESITYARLLPYITVAKFIDIVEKTFGCTFYINTKGREIVIKAKASPFTSTRETLKGTVNLTKPAAGFGLAIKASRNDSPYIAIDESFIDNALISFDVEATSRVHNKIYVNAASPNYIGYPDKYVFCTASQAYFRLSWSDNGTTWDYKAECVHSSYYDISKNAQLDQKTIDSDAEMVPMIPITCRQFYKNISNVNSYFDFSLTVPHFEDWDTITDQINNALTADVTPVSFAFYRGRIEHVDFPTTLFGITDFNIPIGTTDIYDRLGNVITGATLAIRIAESGGIYEKLYKELEQFYLKSGKEVRITNINPSEFFTKDISKAITIDNAHIILNEIKLTLKKNAIRFDSATGYTTKPYS